MEYKKAYYSWLTNELIDLESKRELLSLKSNYEIEDRFYKDLEFGTAGMRGKIGAGTNRMNIYTIGKVTQAFAEIINLTGKNKSVVIAYDVRHKSKEFAEFTASIFAANGINVFISKDILATPITSYAIRKLKADAGVIITASHNPPEYNGYKAYASNGGQILEDFAQDIMKKNQELDYCDIKSVSFEKLLKEGKIKYIPEEIYTSYIDDLFSKSINEEIDKDIKIVYSPFNGTGNKPVKEILKKRGFTNIYIVNEQENPDPDFTSLSFPNPEDPTSFKLSEKLGKEVGADILIATDPDADRLGLMVKDNGGYRYMDGNETGSLLVNYILSQRKEKNTLSEKPAIVKTIVTGDMTKDIAGNYKTKVYETLTGFKNISNVIESLKDKKDEFTFGFEESIGYLYGDSIRDKDGINAAMLVAEMAAYYKKQGKTLIEVLDSLYEKYGYYLNKQFSVMMKGVNGQSEMENIVESFRKNPIKEINNIKLDMVIDYLNDETGLTKSNVLKFFYGENWIAIRPSGTEPKLKFYINIKCKDKDLAKLTLNIAEKLIMERL